MTVLPIVARELRVASRRRSTYWIRTGAALSVIALGTWFFLMMRREPPHQISQVLFGILTGCAMLFCLLSGVRSTADCISEEKREGTLGLLFLTDLKGYDVVLGKLFATSLNEFYAVLAVVPMLGVPLLMGGITLGEFGRMALVAVNTMFFSLCLGLCVSAVSRSPRKAMGSTLAGLLIFSAALPAWAAFLTASGRVRRFPTELFLTSPGFSYYMAWDAPFLRAQGTFWLSVGLIHGLAWLLLITAAFAARHSWQDKPAGVQAIRWRERWTAWSHGNLEQRNAFRRHLLDVNAFYWLAARSRLKPAAVWAAVGLLGCGWVYGWAKLGEEWLNPGLYITTAIVLNLTLKGWYASEVGRQIAEDRKNGALELLLSTPLSIRELLHGQRLALQRQFLGPVALSFVLAFVFMIAPGPDSIGAEDRTSWIVCWLLALASFLADLVTLFWVGLWQGLSARNPNRASGASFARVVVIPSIAFAFVCSIRALLSMDGGQDPGWVFFAGWWFGIGFVNDLLFASQARARLLSEFRLRAAQRYVPRAGFWKRFFGASQHAPAP